MNSNINDEYRKMLSDMDANMSNPKDIEYAKTKMYELSMLFIDEMQAMADGYDDKINAIVQKQQGMDEKLKNMEKELNHMQRDMYDFEDVEENEVFEFEITCPYCNYVFAAEADENKKEVQCPECENIIELDWDGLEEEGFCSGSCGHCHGCEEDEYDDEDDDDM